MAAADQPLLEQTERIRVLNDALRRTFVGGEVMLTAGVSALPDIDRHALLRSVQAFEAFNSDNDPHGEHDFGAIDQDGARFFWKIDYYDPQLTSGSSDAADPAVTRRVLTIMCAEEY